MNHRFTVDGPVSDLVVVLKPGVRVLGQVTEEGANTEPFDLIRLQVAALTWEDDDLLLVTPDTRVRPGGSFVLDEVVGRATLRVSRVPVGWTVTAVSRGGVDITDVPTDFSTPVGQAGPHRRHGSRDKGRGRCRRQPWTTGVGVYRRGLPVFDVQGNRNPCIDIPVAVHAIRVFET